MDKTVSLSRKEIIEIMLALSSRAEKLLSLINRYSGESLEYCFGLEVPSYLIETYQTVHSLMSKLESL